MIIKKSIRVVLSVFLLLCFSVTAIPLDFLHDHSAEQTTCSSSLKHSTCNHKLHISKKATYCLACVVHFDKNFTFTYSVQTYLKQTFIKVFIQDSLIEQSTEALISFLRGPPSY